MLVAIDTETAAIRPGLQFPPMACLSWAAIGGDGADRGSGLVEPRHARDAIEYWAGTDAVFTGAHIAFDLGVLCMHDDRLIPIVFRLLEADRVTDILLRQKLLDIARLGYTRPAGLAGLAARYKVPGHEELAADKNDDDGPRKGYGRLIGVPFDQWTERERAYPVLDAIATLKVHKRQPDHPTLVDQYRQARGAWFTTLTSARGMITDPHRVEAFRQRVMTEHAELRESMRCVGLIHPAKEIKRGPNPRIVPGGKNKKAAQAWIERAYTSLGMKVPTTDKGNISTDRIACEDSGDQTLIDYAHFVTLDTIKNKDLPILIRGTYETIHPRYDSLLTTGRTATSGPNTQNFAARVKGLRECFIPRSGHLFVSADFGGLELACWAQICLWMFGRSRLADALNSGEDGHLMLAATLLGQDYESLKPRKGEPAVKKARNVAKQGNFGFMGGMGIARFVATCRKWGIVIDHDEARRVKDAWMATWPEARPYLDWAARQSNDGVPLTQWVSQRVRKTRGYCDLANSPFQGLGADLAKHVGYGLVRACYLEPGPLYGCKPVNFPHDEYILEAPEHRASECAMALRDLMEAHCKLYVPDVRLRADPCISRVWSKAAEGVYDSAGRLIPWEEPQC